jgi:hypothetical protein
MLPAVQGQPQHFRHFPGDQAPAFFGEAVQGLKTNHRAPEFKAGPFAPTDEKFQRMEKSL